MAEAPPARRAPGLIGLGFSLARLRGFGLVGLVIAGLTVLAGAVAAFYVVHESGVLAPLHDIPSLTASALGWGAGVMVAFSAARQALRRDKDEGVLSLVRVRGGSASSYLVGRVVGLALRLAVVLVGGTLVTWLVCLALADRHEVRLVVSSGLASLVYSVAFAAVLAPVAMAALGARSRAGGYVALLAVLALPELLERWLGDMLPKEWRGLASIPGALSELRSSLMPPALDAARLGRATIVLGVAGFLAVAFLRHEVAMLEEERPA